MLLGSPFERRAHWPHAVVILRRDEKRITSRADFTGWLTSNDLRAAARECTNRRIPPGAVLVWLEVDAEEVSTAGFVVVSLTACNAGTPAKLNP